MVLFGIGRRLTPISYHLEQINDLMEDDDVEIDNESEVNKIIDEVSNKSKQGEVITFGSVVLILRTTGSYAAE